MALKVFCVFVDLGKAFDRIVRKKLWEILHRHNVNEPLLQAVKCLYRDHSACVRVGAGKSPWFDIRSSVKQGCVMSAWSFNLYLDSCLQGVKQSDMGVMVTNTCNWHSDDAMNAQKLEQVQDAWPTIFDHLGKNYVSTRYLTIYRQ